MVDTVRTLAALQALLADNTAGDISAQDARDVLVSSWTPEWMRYLLHRLPDETPHTDDKFFAPGAGSAYAGGTALTVNGTSTWTEGRNLLSQKYSGQNGTNYDIAAQIWSMTPTSAPVTIETHARILSGNGGNASGALFLGFCDGTAGSSGVAAGYVKWDSSKIQIMDIGDDFQSPTYNNFANYNVQMAAQLGSGLYMRAVWTAANTWKWAFSPDGVGWTALARSSYSRTLTPSRFFVGGINIVAGAPAVTAYDYVRVYDADLSA